jgi:aminopeptidase N
MWFGNAVRPRTLAGHLVERGLGDRRDVAVARAPRRDHRADALRQRDEQSPTSTYWQLAIADPGPFNLFAGQVYNRGAATLHALRGKVGEDVFFEGAREWVARYGDPTATSEDLEALYEELSGQDLGEFFDIWLRRPEKPADW